MKNDHGLEVYLQDIDNDLTVVQSIKAPNTHIAMYVGTAKDSRIQLDVKQAKHAAWPEMITSGKWPRASAAFNASLELVGRERCSSGCAYQSASKNFIKLAD